MPGPARATWRRLERDWARPWSLEASGWLAAAAGATLFLDSAATVEIGFTLRPPYVLLALATAIGLPWVLSGWERLPSGLRISAVALVVIYVAAAILGTEADEPPGLARTSNRELVYLADLILGLGTVGLLTGLRAAGWPLRRVVWGLVVGLVAAASYAVYQWPAQHFGWPAADINNSLNSDNFSRGHRNQGVGVFGWERIRGTFKEPLVLASYVAAVVPFLIAALAMGGRRARGVLAPALVVCAAALFLTSSSLTWGLTLLVVLALVTTWAVVAGRPWVAGMMGALFITAVLVAPVLFSHPGAVAGTTGRTPEQLQDTVASRRDAWRNVGSQWTGEPLIGHGPGQSSVLLALRPDPGTSAPVVLGSAQGLWGAALLDAGLVGLAAWALTLGCLFLAGAGALRRGAGPLAWATVAAAAIATLVGLIVGDRLDSKVWLLLGLVAALSVPAARQAVRTRDRPSP